MATGLPKSPRPGRKLTAAINIPKSSDSKVFLEPKVPKGLPSSPLGKISSSKKSGPHPPSSPRPSTPNFHQVRSPFGSPNDHGGRPRRHTVSVVEPVNVVVPTTRHNTFPSFDMFDALDDDPDFKESFGKDRDEAQAENRQPIPVSSSFFQQAMLDLKRRPSRSSQSSVDDDDTKGNAMSTRAHHPIRSPPAIEISHFEENHKDFSLDIELNAQDNDDDDDLFGENKLSNSAPDSFIHETRKSTILRLQIARAKLSSSERALNRTPSIKQKGPPKNVITKNDTSFTSPKSPRKSKQASVLISVDTSPLGRPLRKWRSTEGSLPDLGTATASIDDHYHIDHSPFLSSPIQRRKASMPAVLLTSPKLKQRSTLQDLESSFKSGEKQGKPKPSNLSPIHVPSTRRPKSAHASSTSMSNSSSSDSPTSSPRMRQETTDQPVKSNRGHPHISPLSIKTVNQITQFITAAAASASLSGSSTRKNLLPDAVSLPPVLDSSGRLRVHRRRDDSMRLAKQAVDSDHNEWMDRQ